MAGISHKEFASQIFGELTSLKYLNEIESGEFPARRKESRHSEETSVVQMAIEWTFSSFSNALSTFGVNKFREQPETKKAMATARKILDDAETRTRL